jgi:hypothetical protein
MSPQIFRKFLSKKWGNACHISLALKIRAHNPNRIFSLIFPIKQLINKLIICTKKGNLEKPIKQRRSWQNLENK